VRRFGVKGAGAAGGAYAFGSSYRKRGDAMSVAKTIELTSTSNEGFEAAIRDAVAKASESLRNIEGAWVKEQKVLVSDGKVTGFRVHLEVTFVLD
jgi:flavin-binding protein dodecin